MITPNSTRSARRRWWIEMAGAFALGASGFFVPFASARVLMLPALALMGSGLYLVVRKLIRLAPGETVVPLRRKQIALSMAVGVPLFVTLIVVAASIRLGPTAGFTQEKWVDGRRMSAQQRDAELGWAPSAPPNIVGQRLRTIDPSKPSILLLGDSIVYGLTLEDDQSVDHWMEAKLPKWQVLNAAVSGYSIDQYYLTLKRLLPTVRPRAVIVGIFTGNDFQITGREFMWGASKPLFTVQDDKLVRVNRATDCIDGLSQSLLFRAVWRSRDLSQRAIDAICSPRYLARGELEDVIRHLFDGMDTLARDAGVPILYALLPERNEYNLFNEERHKYLSKHRDVRRLLEERKRDVLDFEADLLLHRADFDALYLPDNAHYTVKGQQLLAEALLREMATRNGITP